MPKLTVICRRFGVGSEIWVLRQIQQFQDFETKVICWRKVEPSFDYDEKALPTRILPPAFSETESVPTRWLRRLGNLPSRNFLAPPRAEHESLRAALLEQKPDVLLCHFGHVALRVLPVARELGIPLVCHFHGLDLSSSLNDRYYRHSLVRWAPSFAHHIVVGSHQRRLLESLGIPSAKISLIPCGAPTENFTPRSEDRDEGCTFIAVSRLVPWKGVMETVDAFARIAPEMPSARLEIIGTGPLSEDLCKRVDTLGLWNQIKLLGGQSSAQVSERMKAANVFVQHSLDYTDGWNEGFGVSITEASATGLPVIVTNSGGIPDQVRDGENGLIVTQRDIGAYADAMRRLAGDAALRSRLGRAGRENAVAHFDSALLSARLQERLLAAVKV